MRPTGRRALATGWDAVRRGLGRPEEDAAKNQISPTHRQAAIIAMAMVIS
jgi:hypothetical protein